MDLDEVKTVNLVKELLRRRDHLNKNLCPYCGKGLEKAKDGARVCVCKMGKEIEEVYESGLSRLC
jgi:ferredoxin-thioredoxin reductase catalytic subunit